MGAAIRTRFLPSVVALCTVAGFARPADAGWITVKNDTNTVIVIQETVTTHGQSRTGKPIRLLPGESIREYQATGSRTIEVFDGRDPKTSLVTSSVTVKAENQTVTVACDGPAVRIVSDLAKK
jgi:hypothetical protein